MAIVNSRMIPTPWTEGKGSPVSIVAEQSAVAIYVVPIAASVLHI